MSDLAARIAGLSPERQALLAARLRGGRPEARPAREPLAIVGLGCRFPGGIDSPQRFWRLLRDGVDPIEEVPRERWDPDAFYAEDREAPGKMVTRWGGFLPPLDRFEPSFFGISPREAATLDPQQRIVLEVAWEALEDAGQTSERLAGSRTGVYVGTHTTDYSWMLFTGADGLDAYASTGTARSIVANRLSYVFDLRGPSVSVDTACSASLVAVHLACQALRAHECDLAIAGGVNLLMSPLWSVALSKLGILAPDGRCKTFDARANGIVRSEGCGIVVLKRLSDVAADGDRVWAIIRGTATNQDGRSNGITAPSGLAQQAVVRQALADAGVQGADVGVVETHGTGTPLGDPIEIESLAAVLGTGDRPCLLGAVKTNLGHCEGAAGIAGLIKTVLSLHHEAVPALAHFRELNPHIDLSGTRFALPRTLSPWPRGAHPRIAGVSAFGFGGSNAHVVLEEAPAATTAVAPRRVHVLPLSARGPEALRRLVEACRENLTDAPATVDVAELCATAALRRTHASHRRAVIGASVDELLAGLARGLERTGPASDEAPPGVAFVFSGQGTQWSGMGRDLLASEPAFRRVVEECDRVTRAEVGWSLLELLTTADEPAMARTELAQPAIFAVQAGVAAVLASWGIVPSAVTGHSVGEIAAAHVAGALSLADAVRIVVHRARLMQRTQGRGRMVSVELSEREAARAIEAHPDRLSIAAVNAPDTTVLAGDGAALAGVVEDLQRRGVVCHWLPVDYAFHSPQMEALRAPLVEAVRALTSSEPSIPLVSTVTGHLVTAGVLDAEYWGRNLREPVRLAAAVEALGALGVGTFVEIGPHPVLGGAITRTLATSQRSGLALASLRRGQPGEATLLALLGRLWERGQHVNWSALYAMGRPSVALPPTPWQYESHPLRVGPTAGALEPGVGTVVPGGHPLLARRLATAQLTYETRLDREAPAYLSDHRIDGVTIVPGTALIDVALHAGAEALGVSRVRLEDLVIRRPVVVDGPAVLQVTVVADAPHGGEVRLFSSRGDAPAGPAAWTLHATARIVPDAIDSADAGDGGDPTIEALRAGVAIGEADHYDAMRARGAAFGPAFRGVRRIWRGEDTVLAEIECPAALTGPDAGTRMHPALLDACLQPLGTARDSDEPMLLVPMAADSIRVHGAAARVWSQARVRRHADGVTADVRIVNEAGSLIAELRGLVLRARPRATTPMTLSELAWVRRPLDAAARRASRGAWLVVADATGVADDLARELTAHDHAVTLLRDASLPAGSRPPWTDIVDLRALDTASVVDVDGPAMQAAAVESTARVLQLVQQLHAAATPRLWLVTRGAQLVTDDDSALAVAQAPLWGLGRTIALERPELRTTLVDLDPRDVVGAKTLVQELLGGDGEAQVALRAGERHVSRLQAVAGDGGAAARAPELRLDLHQRGVLDNLTWVPAGPATPGPGQIAIAVEASGLNFRDVLNALGMYPGDAGPLGGELAGRVIARGTDVESPALGERVMGVATGTFATTVVTDARLVAPVPVGLSAEAAATIPVAFLTAHWALAEVARLRHGQRVLIHAAAGGVGLAAVALAQRAGAEVFATAGSADKRALLASLGVRHVWDSRSLDFETAILAETGGRGVDVVLNSLTGEFIPASLRVTAADGCFVEIGKRGIWEPDRVAALRPDLAYHVLYLGDLFAREPSRVQRMLARLATDFATGELKPLPYRVYPATDVVDAFRFMAQARHVGKLVVTPPTSAAPGRVRGDATYLITGGTGALGLRTAEWLHARGARHLVLMSRSTPSPQVRARIAHLAEQGVTVRVIAGDVAHTADVRAVIEEIERTLPPLRGVVHAAGVLADAVLSGQSEASLASVMAPKVAGAWNLHLHCAGMPLDFFVVFSSIASVLGSAGQANYAAANAFLDALAALRRSRNEPALTLGWGPWKGGGMAASLAEPDRRRWEERGVRALTSTEALAGLERALTMDRAHVTVAAIDWSRYHPGAPAGRDAVGPVAPSMTIGEPSLLHRLETMPAARRSAALLGHVREEVARVLQLAPGQAIEPDRGLKELGLDSLMAVELRNRLQASTGRVWPTTLAFDHPTLGALVRHLEQELFSRAAATPAPTPSATDLDSTPEIGERLSDDAVADLSDEEASQLLLEEIARGRDAGQEVAGG